MTPTFWARLLLLGAGAGADTSGTCKSSLVCASPLLVRWIPASLRVAGPPEVLGRSGTAVSRGLVKYWSWGLAKLGTRRRDLFMCASPFAGFETADEALVTLVF